MAEKPFEKNDGKSLYLLHVRFDGNPFERTFRKNFSEQRKSDDFKQNQPKITRKSMELNDFDCHKLFLIQKVRGDWKNYVDWKVYKYCMEILIGEKLS